MHPVSFLLEEKQAGRVLSLEVQDLDRVGNAWAIRVVIKLTTEDDISAVATAPSKQVAKRNAAEHVASEYLARCSNPGDPRVYSPFPVHIATTIVGR